MNYVISICNPKELEILTNICSTLELPINVVLRGRGTAAKSMLDILGIESNEKRIVLSVAGADKTKQFIKEQRRQMFVDIPGHGIIVAIPIKSVGGGKTVEFLNGNDKNAAYTPEINCSYELIVVVANEGRTDMVMNAARAAGATGGTVLHGKGTGVGKEKAFFNVSIVHEKEVVLIVSKISQKADIMRCILEKAGPSTEAGGIVFSLPISEVAGLGMFED